MLKKSICLILTTMLISVFITTGAVASSKFTDVDDYWATDAINWAAEKGVVKDFRWTFKPLHVSKRLVSYFGKICHKYRQSQD